MKEMNEKELPKLRRGGLFVVALVLLIFVLLDAFRILSMGAYQGSLALIGVAGLLFLATKVIRWRKESRTLRFFGRMVIISTILELTLFQLPSYSLLSGGYEQKTFLPTSASISGGESTIDETSGAVTVTGKDQVIMEFQQLDMPVGTIQVDVDYGEKTKRAQLKIDMADETHVDYRYDIASGVVVKDNDNSNYTACRFSGDVSQLRLKVSCFNDNDSVTIQAIHFNKTIPFDISAIRFGFLTLVTTFCYGIVVSSFLKKPFRETRKSTTASVLALTGAAVLLATSIIMIKLPEDGFASRWKLEAGNQITQELVDAFENKQVNLLKEPTEQLINMENPYDWSARNQEGVSAEWDHVYYDGKYYSYYGIAPVLTFFLPYHKLTGHYFACDMAVWIFSCIGLVFLGLTYLAIAKRWFRDVPAGCVIGGFVILLTVCGIWYSVGRTIFYEIAMSCGFMYLNAGAYFLISSNMLTDGKTSFVRTALCSLFLGLAVLSRPTLAVYAICAAVFLLMSIKSSSSTIKGRILFILCAAVPICVLGGFQMWYNAARFGSPFDFGIKYSLTINDFVHSQFHLVFVLIVLFNFLFAVPGFSTDFPYIKTPFSSFHANGYYFADAGNTSGIFFLALPVFGYLLSGRALRRLPDRKSRLRYGTLVGLPCVIMPLIIICSIWESGYAIRYTADFSWEIIIGALAVLFWLYRMSTNETKKTWFRGFLACSVMMALVINIVQIIPFAFSENDYPEVCRAMQDVIAFWD